LSGRGSIHRFDIDDVVDFLLERVDLALDEGPRATLLVLSGRASIASASMRMRCAGSFRASPA
jgi:hypothetical protein